MKYLSLVLLALSFSAVASNIDHVATEVQCVEGEQICEYKPYYIGKTQIFSRGLGKNYAAAERAADARLYKKYPNRSCGIGVTIMASRKAVRLRDGSMGEEVWVVCHPSKSLGDRGDLRSGRQGTFFGNEKGGFVIKSIPGL